MLRRRLFEMFDGKPPELPMHATLRVSVDGVMQEREQQASWLRVDSTREGLCRQGQGRCTGHEAQGGGGMQRAGAAACSLGRQRTGKEGFGEGGGTPQVPSQSLVCWVGGSLFQSPIGDWLRTGKLPLF